MKKLTLLVFICLALCALAVCAVFAAACCAGGVCATSEPAIPDNTLSAQEKASGYELVFDGATFANWDCTEPGSKGWLVDNGAIFYNVKGGGYMYTKERYGDFDLMIDFMVDNRTNSGIFFRWSNLKDPVQTGFEMQVLDSSAAKNPGKHDCGALYDVLAPTENTMKPALEWNTAFIQCRGSFITISLNGKRVVATNLDRYTEAHKSADGTANKFNTAYKDMAREGHIGLQAHGGKVWFKNIKVRHTD